MLIYGILEEPVKNENMIKLCTNRMARGCGSYVKNSREEGKIRLGQYYVILLKRNEI